MAIFSTAYFGPISYFQQMLKYESDLIIESKEHFVKQTYRNRCVIAGANGPLNLIVPLKKRGERLPIDQVEISYDEDWKKLHLRSIESAYRSSPYYEFYEDEFIALFEEHHETLFDWNMACFNWINEILELELKVQVSERYEKEVANDFRLIISPKKESLLEMEEYYQVFSSRNGFLSDLSILDALFHLGPQSVNKFMPAK